MKKFLAAIIFFLSCLDMFAQYTTYGSDPWRARWKESSTENFRIIYPRGLDSLAFSYGRALEYYRPLNAISSGFMIGQNYRGKMPVIIHAYGTVNNGAVVWAPRRIEMFVSPNPYNPTPFPSVPMLALHEGRHAAQMQFGKQGALKVGHWLLGETSTGILSGIFPGHTLLEGDAVVAETALTNSGRGRQMSFFEYMMPAFDCGDLRDYWQWMYGGQREYAPDYYRVGYMLVSGMRVFYDDPLFTQEYFERVNRRFGFFTLQKTVKAASGIRFKDAFRNIEKKYASSWSDYESERAPFNPMIQLTPKPRLHTDYTKSTSNGHDVVYSVKNGLDRSSTLVRISSGGKETVLRPFASYASKLCYDSVRKRVYWTETVGSRRWSLEGDSRIRYFDVSHPRRFKNLTKKGRYYNVCVSPDGSKAMATEYTLDGHSRICLINTSDGHVETYFDAPDSLQITKTTFMGDRIFAAGLSENGFGIYEVSSDGYRRVLGPQHCSIVGIGSMNGKVTFVSDRTGVSEFYMLDPSDGTLTQMTSTRYGISFVFFQGDTLCYSSVAASDKPETYRQGKMLYGTPLSTLHPKTVSFDDAYRYKIADKLSAQEKALAAEHPELGINGLSALDSSRNTTFTAPKAYSKIQLPHIHSWVPVYFNYNSTSDLSGDDYYETASLGATVLFQNLLGTGWGSLGYSFHKDPYSDDYRHSAHLNYTYTGLLPVFNVSVDFGDHDKMDMMRSILTDEKGDVHLRMISNETSTPFFRGKATVYIPLNFSSGGWSRGLIPQVKYEISNNEYDEDVSIDKVVMGLDGNRKIENVSVMQIGNKNWLQHITPSLRGYIVQPAASSAIFPRSGIGAEIGYKFYPNHQNAFSNTAYAYFYGYIPGLISTHGLRITGTWQHQFSDGRWCFGQNPIDAFPRGFSSDGSVSDFYEFYGRNQYHLTFDYAIPIALPFKGSITSPLFYMKRLELVPFADLSWISLRNDLQTTATDIIDGTLKFCSFGASLALRLSNFLWLPFESTVGIRVSCNTWDNPSGIITSMLDPSKVRTEFLFTVDL